MDQIVLPAEQQFWIRILSSGLTGCTPSPQLHGTTDSRELSTISSQDTNKEGSFNDNAHSGDKTAEPVTSPILELPEEISINIFLRATDRSTKSVSGRAKLLVRCQRLMSISHVCRSWRYITTSCMPLAWSTIRVTKPRVMGIARLVELWLIRTGTTCPLNLTFTQGQFAPHFDIQPTIEILSLFVSCVDRWHTISFCLGLHSPLHTLLSLPTPRNLVTVSSLIIRGWDDDLVEQIWDTINGSTELRTIYWKNFVPQSTPWSQIEAIGLTNYTLQPIEHGLHRLTRLHSLYISVEEETVLQVGSQPILLPSLRTLHFSGPGIWALLDHIATPSLQEISIAHQVKTMYSNPLPCISQLLLRSSCSLVAFSITDSFKGQQPEDLITFLCQSSRNLNTLRKLSLRYECIPDEVMLLLTVPCSGQVPPSMPDIVLFPVLQSLELNICSPARAGLVGSLLKSRFRHSSLQSAHIGITQAHEHGEDLLVLQSLKEEGKDLSWLMFA